MVVLLRMVCGFCFGGLVVLLFGVDVGLLVSELEDFVGFLSGTVDGLGGVPEGGVVGLDLVRFFELRGELRGVERVLSGLVGGDFGGVL